MRYPWSSITRTPKLSEVSLNPYNPQGENGAPWFFTTGEMTFNTDPPEFYHRDVEGWETDVNAGEQRVHIKEDIYWHQDGEIIDDFVAEDWVIWNKLDRAVQKHNESWPDTPLVTDWHADGDKTLVQVLNPDGVNGDVVSEPGRFRFLGVPSYRDGWFAEQLQALEDASSDSAREEVITGLINEQRPITESPILSGPFFLTRTSEQRLDFERVPEHWTSSLVNWKTFHAPKLGGEEGHGSASQAAIANDRIEVAHADAPQALDTMPPQTQQIDAKTMRGEAIGINYMGSADPILGLREDDKDSDGNYWVGKRQALVRQAIMLAIDKEKATKNRAGRSAPAADTYDKAVPQPERLVKENWPDLWEALPDYKAPQPERAEEKLAEAGLSKENGTWIKPNGEPFRFVLHEFTWIRAAMTGMAQDLKDIGIQAEVTAPEMTKLINDAAAGEHYASQWGLGTDRDKSVVGNTSRVWRPQPGWSILNRPGVTSDVPGGFMIPPEIGDIDGEPTEKVVPRELTDGFLTQPTEEIRDRVKKAIWTLAYHLPVLPMFAIVAQCRINKRHFTPPQPTPPRGDTGFTTATAEHHKTYGCFSNNSYIAYGFAPSMAKTN